MTKVRIKKATWNPLKIIVVDLKSSLICIRHRYQSRLGLASRLYRDFCFVRNGLYKVYELYLLGIVIVH